MNKIALVGLAILASICISGQMPYKKNPEVAVTKEVAPLEAAKEVPVEEAKKEEKRVGAAKKILRTQNETRNSERKGAAQKVREGIR